MLGRSLEPSTSEQCSLREVSLQYDWVDGSFFRTAKGTEPSLVDFSSIIVSTDAMSIHNSVPSSCPNKHNAFSIDFIYDYVDASGKTVVTNAIHFLISPAGAVADHYGSDNDEITFATCYTHAIYGSRVCGVMVRADKWGVMTISDLKMSSYTTVSADFKILADHYEKAGLLETCASCGEQSGSRIRHVQFVNSTRSGDRYVRIRNSDVQVKTISN